ncbi:UNVERIFIED_CONTAM: hypothetical protein Sindi_1842800 [Sesamum indicum]
MATSSSSQTSAAKMASFIFEAGTFSTAPHKWDNGARQPHPTWQGRLVVAKETNWKSHVNAKIGEQIGQPF